MSEENDIHTTKPEIKRDPAEILLSNSKYHDCYLTVGNPETDQVEKIGVASANLIAHSPVFQDMLERSDLADPTGTNTHITDVSPATFKLMLRHIYGSKLPKITPDEAAELALCADKYNIQRLVLKACKRLRPTAARDVFPALLCAAYITCPDLELEVTKIVQQQTDKVVQHADFLLLDENCLLFIVKQSMLNITEWALWNNVVCWAANQVQKQPEKTLRDCLSKVLGHIRLLSLSVDEIIEHVLPTKILNYEELTDLMTVAAKKKKLLESPRLCKILEKREIYKLKTKEKPVLKPELSGPVTLPNLQFKTSHVFSAKNCKTDGNVLLRLSEVGLKKCSTFNIKPSEPILVESLTFKSLSLQPNNNKYSNSYTFTCNIEISKSVKGNLVNRQEINIENAVVYNENILLPIKMRNGQPLIVNAAETCTFNLVFNLDHPVHELYYIERAWGRVENLNKPIYWVGLEITFKDYFHVIQIDYKTK